MLKSLQQMQSKPLQKEQFKKQLKQLEILIGNKVADKTASVSKKSPKEFHSKELSSNEANIEIPKERYISPQERQQIIDELRLI